MLAAQSLYLIAFALFFLCQPFLPPFQPPPCQFCHEGPCHAGVCHCQELCQGGTCHPGGPCQPPAKVVISLSLSAFPVPLTSAVYGDILPPLRPFQLPCHVGQLPCQVGSGHGHSLGALLHHFLFCCALLPPPGLPLGFLFALLLLLVFVVVAAPPLSSPYLSFTLFLSPFLPPLAFFRRLRIAVFFLWRISLALDDCFALAAINVCFVFAAMDDCFFLADSTVKSSRDAVSFILSGALPLRFCLCCFCFSDLLSATSPISSES